ncbi:MAG: peptide ABC transporter permease [Candidatus Omnitrophica bacterium CG1_02_46_14]|nr:MAG: peptide ABC transporter permease [Candidatus Omnitrophica bacterium CG1_02_46_14]
MILRLLLNKKCVRLAFLWLLGVAGLSLIFPIITGMRHEAMNFTHILEAPSAYFWLGTDSLGRDLLSRLLSGALISLGVGLLAVGLSILIGMTIGAVAGYYGGWVDKSFVTLVDLMLCFPVFFLILAVIAVLGPNIMNVIIVIGVTSWMGTARLVRAEVLTLKEREFILASRALGAGDSRILFLHLIPNALGPVIVNAILGVSSAILTETALSFLGIGVQPPTPSWGNILMDGKATLGVAWWLTLFPGLMILLTVLSTNVIGEEFHKIIQGHRR